MADLVVKFSAWVTKKLHLEALDFKISIVRVKNSILITLVITLCNQCTEVHFASFFSGGFITVIVAPYIYHYKNIK